MNLRIILICLFFSFGVTAIAQPFLDRAGPSYTPQDVRLAAKWNFIVPRFQDTTQANVYKGLDSCGAVI